MESAGYVTLSRQSSLMREMQVVANNIANISTTGFRREGVVFSEFLTGQGQDPSLSMARGNVRYPDLSQAPVTMTNAPFDFAIQGEGFFLIETPDGEALTRAGTFTPNAAGELVNPDGFRLLDAGGAPIFVPPGAGPVAMAQDGSLSAGGQPIARVGLWLPTDPATLRHRSGTLFTSGGVEPAQDGTLLQGYLEESNVNPIQEVARMIEVQRAYELGQSFMDMEDRRIRGAIDRMGK